MSPSFLLSYGSVSGQWTYPLIRTPAPVLLWFGIVLAGALLLLRWMTHRTIDRYPATCIAAWTLIGWLTMVFLHFLSYFSLGSLVSSDLSNGFFTASLRYGPLAILAEYPDLPNLPYHVWTNMPGKVLLFHFLRLFTESPQALGVLIVLLASLSGLLLFGILRELEWKRAVGLDAWILWMVTPALIGFLPILNTVTVTFALLVFFLVLKAIRTNSLFFPILSGMAAFWLFLFEPTPFALALIGVPILIGLIRRETVPIRHVMKILGIMFATFLLSAILLWLFTGFDPVQALTHVVLDALAFDAKSRPYLTWVLPQLKDFFLGAGILPSAIFLLSIVASLRLRRKRATGNDQHTAAALLAIASLSTILLLDLTGIGRGEVVRFWIFLMPFVSAIAAAACQKRTWLFSVILSATILQTAISVWSIVFVLPTNPFLL
ncbi:MAG: hypothetical protein PHZ00_03600 [Candidatus Peribacteraceae bacterium]|nr:hypothetical protein [Candidatus Peribacteraceae bacterium]